MLLLARQHLAFALALEAHIDRPRMGKIEFAVLDYCCISTPAFWQGYVHPRGGSPSARIRR